jgi:hypothetical protein
MGRIFVCWQEFDTLVGEGFRQRGWRNESPNEVPVLHFTKLFGVRKLSQNNTQADRDGVIAGQPRDNPALGQLLARKTAG